MNLWDESFWLPNNVSWNDLQSNASIRYPDVRELGYTFIYGALLLLVRIFIECFVFLPLGYIFGWVSAPKGILSRTLTHLKFGFAGKSKFKRVAETAWRLLFYSIAWVSGLYILWDQPQFSDVSECWRYWPHHPVSEGIWWYYIIETSFYCSLLFSSVAFDIRRADFFQMTVHHLITIILLFTSFSINMIRIGTLILLSHDMGDILIELGKLFRYAHWNNALMVVFCIFLVVWTATRLIYYPFWIIYSALFDAPPLLQENYRWENLTQQPIVPRILVGMLTCLLLLHFFWTYIIIKVAVSTVREGNVDDIREKDADEPETEKSPEEVTLIKKSGSKKDL